MTYRNIYDPGPSVCRLHLSGRNSVTLFATVHGATVIGVYGSLPDARAAAQA